MNFGFHMSHIIVLINSCDWKKYIIWIQTMKYSIQLILMWPIVNFNFLKKQCLWHPFWYNTSCFRPRTSISHLACDSIVETSCGDLGLSIFAWNCYFLGTIYMALWLLKGYVKILSCALSFWRLKDYHPLSPSHQPQL